MQTKRPRFLQKLSATLGGMVVRPKRNAGSRLLAKLRSGGSHHLFDKMVGGHTHLHQQAFVCRMFERDYFDICRAKCIRGEGCPKAGSDRVKITHLRMCTFPRTTLNRGIV